MGSQSRLLRGALVMLTSLGAIAVRGHVRPAYAAGDDEDDGGDDDEPGGKAVEEDIAPDEDKDQPPVTSGGLFTLKTYPVSELLRPLVLNQGMLQARIGGGTDITAKKAFLSFGASVEAKYGLRDNVMALAGLTDSYNLKQFALYAGVEASLAYDLVDVRAAFRFGRQVDPKVATLPDGTQGVIAGEVEGGRLKAAIDLGFPFRYVARPELAIVALDTLVSIDLNDASTEIPDPGDASKTLHVGNRWKPDLNPSLGIATNPIPALSVVIFAQLQIVDLDTTAKFKVPATVRAQFSPNQKLDLGLEFSFLDVKPPDGQKFYDNRFLTLYAQFRTGK